VGLGPPRYASRDVHDMLSGEEILDLSRDTGVEIVAEGMVDNIQFEDDVSLASLISHNFASDARTPG
jgi:hypothetical protein